MAHVISLSLVTATVTQLSALLLAALFGGTAKLSDGTEITYSGIFHRKKC